MQANSKYQTTHPIIWPVFSQLRLECFSLSPCCFASMICHRKPFCSTHSDTNIAFPQLSVPPPFPISPSCSFPQKKPPHQPPPLTPLLFLHPSPTPSLNYPPQHKPSNALQTFPHVKLHDIHQIYNVYTIYQLTTDILYTVHLPHPKPSSPPPFSNDAG